MTAVRAVLFDLDHTLFDTARTERIALGVVARARGFRLTAPAFDAYQSANTRTWAEYRAGTITSDELRVLRFQRWLSAIGRDPSDAAGIGRTYLRAFSARCDLVTGARAALRRLSARGYRLGVVTNGIDRVQRERLRRGALGGYFRGAILTSERVGVAKPDPRIIVAALRRVRCAPEAAVYVGDDPAVDGRAAAAAGVRFVWFGSTAVREAPDYVWRRARSLAELPPLISG